MSVMKKCLWLVALAMIAYVPAPSRADDKDENKTEQIKEIPDEIKSIIPRTAASQAQLAWVFFYEAGTTNIVQSVSAGKKFDIVVLLNSPAPANVEVTVRSFRLDVSGLDSGSVKVLPIATGSGATYWVNAPSSPLTIQSGNRGVRNRNVMVDQNAMQPAGGDATTLEPVRFPDHVILFVKQGDVVLSPTLRIAKP